MPEYSRVAESGLGEQLCDGFGRVYAHAFDAVGPCGVVGVARLVADEDHTAAFEYAGRFGEGTGQVFPEIYCFEGRNEVECPVVEWQRVGRTLRDEAAAAEDLSEEPPPAAAIFCFDILKLALSCVVSAIL